MSSITGFLGYVPYYSSDGVEAMRIPAVSAYFNYNRMYFEMPNASYDLPNVVFLNSFGKIYGVITEVGELHVKGTDVFDLYQYGEKVSIGGVARTSEDTTFPVLIRNDYHKKYEPGWYDSTTDILTANNSTSYWFDVTLELVSEPEPEKPADPSTLDSTSFLQGWLIGRRLAGMRKLPDAPPVDPPEGTKARIVDDVLVVTGRGTATIIDGVLYVK